MLGKLSSMQSNWSDVIVLQMLPYMSNTYLYNYSNVTTKKVHEKNKISAHIKFPEVIYIYTYNSAPHLQGTEWPCSTISRTIHMKICTTTAPPYGGSKSPQFTKMAAWNIWKASFPQGSSDPWNPVLLSVKQAPSIDSFKTTLKTYLFNKAFW